MSLLKFLNSNNIEEENVKQIVYNMLIMSIFEELYIYLEDNNHKEILKGKLRKGNTDEILKKFIGSRINISLTTEEEKYLQNLLIAYLRKKETRKKMNDEFRILLLDKQNYECKICKKNINSKNSHLDHNVPFKLVGDELKDNYQMLCEECNWSKNASLTYHFRSIIKSKMNN